ncbi:MAG TPA: hypothetical protein PK760_10745, partial [Flavobacteriales bacterium]|nr:hypothetical protein [Flavobacteriales bacterium]
MNFHYPERSWLFAGTLLAMVCAAPHGASAQVSMSATGSYSQNFDTPTLANSGTTNAWTDNSTIANWYWQQTNVSTVYQAGTGSGTGGARYSFGLAAASDRAMGTLASGTATALAEGLLLQNTSGQAITDIKVTYTGEQYRDGGNASLATQPLSFYYQISGAPITNLSAGSNGAWTSVAALNFISPIHNAAAATLDGNQAANRTVFTNVSIPSLTVPNGSYIMLKWDDVNDAGNDHALAIDDV